MVALTPLLPVDSAPTPSSPVGPLPTAGCWVRILLDAVDLGLSDEDRKNTGIAAALAHLKEHRTAQRVLSGDTRPEKNWEEVAKHLAVLLIDPPWSPLHNDPIADLGAALKKLLFQWERFSGSMTIAPNLNSALTRTAIRPMIVHSALLLGRCASRRPMDVVKFTPWRPETGVGRVIDPFRSAWDANGRIADFWKKIGWSERSWSRFVSGKVPPEAPFNFPFFAGLAGDTADKKSTVEASARRALSGARLVNRMEEEISVGDDARSFWDDCWDEFERVFRIAENQQTRIDISGDSTRGFAHICDVAGKDATGIWAHVHASLKPDSRYFDWVVSLLVALSSKGVEADAKTIDAAIGEALNRLATHLDARTLDRAFAATGSPEAIRLLKTLPDMSLKFTALGGEHAKQGDLVAARAAYETVFSRAPEEWLSRYSYALFEVRHGDPGHALRLLADPGLAQHHEYHAITGEAHLKLGCHEEALAAFEVCIERQDSLPESHRMAAECCRALGRDSQARLHEKIWQRLRDPSRET